MICSEENTKPSGYSNCWEYWKCSDKAKEACPVFKAKKGNQCWMYMDHLDIFDWAKPKEEYNYCTECPWYKKIYNSKV